MVLIFTALDKFGHEKKYSWWFESLEYALDALSALAVKGRIIIKADCMDEQRRIKLPVEAFDGTCFSAPMKAIEGQWQRILDKPAPAVSTSLVNVTTRPLA